MKSKVLIVLFAPIFLLSMCKQKDSGATESPSEQNTEVNHSTSEDVPKSPKKVSGIASNSVVVFDGFRVRKEPNKKSEVLFKANSGHLLLLTGRESENKEKVVLRDIQYNKPYYEVNTEGAHSANGWIYGGGVLKLYNGASKLPLMNELSAYTNYLNGLRPDDILMGKKAFDYISSNFKNPSPATLDALFIITNNYLTRQERTLWKWTEKLKMNSEDWQKVWDKNFDMTQFEVTKKLFSSGFELQTSEGFVYPIVNTERIKNMLPGKLTGPTSRFAELIHQSKYNPATSDAALIISAEETLKRAVDWEKFERQNPNFVLADDVALNKKRYQNYLYIGTSNSPTFNYQNQKFDSETIQIWEKAARENPNLEVASYSKKVLEFISEMDKPDERKFGEFVNELLPSPYD